MTRIASRWRELRRDGEKGAGGEALELVILTPVIVLVILVCVALGRYSVGASKVDQVAASAARAAAMQHDPTSAQRAAISDAQLSVGQSGVTCRDLTVAVATDGFRIPAGQPATVTVTVRCVVDWSDLTIPGWPGTRLVTATATSPLDVTQERFG